MAELFFKCPKYQECSVNSCPLDSAYPRYTNEMDAAQKCKLKKAKIQN